MLAQNIKNIPGSSYPTAKTSLASLEYTPLGGFEPKTTKNRLLETTSLSLSLPVTVPLSLYLFFSVCIFQSLTLLNTLCFRKGAYSVVSIRQFLVVFGSNPPSGVYSKDAKEVFAVG